MTRLRRLVSPSLVRFALVGSVNTAIDLLLFLALHAAGVPLLLANFVSTSGGLAFSYVANRSFTFTEARGAAVGRQLLAFLLGTGVGLWVVQPIVITAVTALLAGSGVAPEVRTLLAKSAAIGLGVVWNWLLYSRWVFRLSSPRAAEVHAPEAAATS